MPLKHHVIIDQLRTGQKNFVVALDEGMPPLKNECPDCGKPFVRYQRS
jgi:hypothetical protein